MSKSSKVKILEAVQLKGKSESEYNALAFRVQVSKGTEPLIMFYDQLKFSYPYALIQFFEAQAQPQNGEQSQAQQVPEKDEEIFDYDSYVYDKGSKVLEHINSFTLCLKQIEQHSKKQEPNVRGKVYLQEAINFYERTINKNEMQKSPKQEGDQFKKKRKSIEIKQKAFKFTDDTKNNPR